VAAVGDVVRVGDAVPVGVLAVGDGDAVASVVGVGDGDVLVVVGVGDVVASVVVAGDGDVVAVRVADAVVSAVGVGEVLASGDSAVGFGSGFGGLGVGGGVGSPAAATREVSGVGLADSAVTAAAVVGSATRRGDVTSGMNGWGLAARGALAGAGDLWPRRVGLAIAYGRDLVAIGVRAAGSGGLISSGDSMPMGVTGPPAKLAPTRPV
jgi:hypothetical protein